jgi:hypothetical protein
MAKINHGAAEKMEAMPAKTPEMNATSPAKKSKMALPKSKATELPPLPLEEEVDIFFFFLTMIK